VTPASRARRRLAAAIATGALFTSSVAKAVDVPAAGDRSPHVNYMLSCQGCHLPDGSGQAGRVPNLRGEVGKFLWVDGGREYLVQVPGTATSKLSDAETAELLNWLVKTMGPPPPQAFRAYVPSEVSQLRRQWLRNPGELRAQLIARLRADRRFDTPPNTVR